MLVINHNEVAELLSMESCITVMESVLKELSAGQAVQSLRQVLPLQKSNLIGLMPGYLQGEEVAGAKIISVFPSNHGSGLPSHQGLVTLFDSSTGVLKAVVDGQKITAIRTAAVSAVATRYLAREEAEVLAILGTGEQARTHLEAILLVRSIRQVRVWSRSLAKAAYFQTELSRKWGVEIVVAESVQESAQNESGDYLIPLKEGVITPNHIIGEIGELISGTIGGRGSAPEITLFKGLGLAIEDLAAANFIYNEAVRLHKGTEIAF